MGSKINHLPKRAKVIVSEAQSDGSESEPESSHNEDSQQTHSDSDIMDEESSMLLNEGWADSIAKILKMNKPKRKRNLVLSKAKKITDPIRKVIPASYEIAKEGEEVIREETVIEKRLFEPEKPEKKKKRDLPSLRVKPSINDREKERTLQSIATRGVVQFFNAVRKTQKDISRTLEEAGPLDVRREKALKNIDKQAFLNVLMGEKSSSTNKQPTEKMQKKEEPEWEVLRDDFLLGAKMKNWDKEMDVEEEPQSN